MTYTKQQEITKLIEDNPGIIRREIMEKTSCNEKTVDSVILRLRGSGKLRTEMMGRTKRLYLNN